MQTLPDPSNQTEVDTWHSEVLPSIDWQALTKLLTEKGATNQVEEGYKRLIRKGWQINTKEELEKIIAFLQLFKSAFPSIDLEENNYNCKNNQFYIELFGKELIKELSDARVKQHIGELKTDEEKAVFIEKLPKVQALSYYSTFPSLSNYQEKFIAGFLENEFSKFDFLCFDLESDGEKINEFAWKNGSGIKNDSDFNRQEEGIAELVKLLNSGALIIGQNIKEFDLSILANHGAATSPDCIWDTLEMEMLLNPERFSYGLKTQHSAASDTELTHRLFKNQLSRIIVSRSNSAIKDLLPTKAIEVIDKMKNDPKLGIVGL